MAKIQEIKDFFYNFYKSCSICKIIIRLCVSGGGRSDNLVSEWSAEKPLKLKNWTTRVHACWCPTMKVDET